MELSHIVFTKLLDTHSALNDIRNRKALELSHIAVLDEPVPYDIFYAEYIVANQPVILGRWATYDWPCTTSWLKSNGEIDWEQLTETFGNETVPVADCTKQVSYSHPKITMKFKEFISYMTNKSNDNPDYKLLYLKDWHFQRDFSSIKAYTTPLYFRSDWLNEFWESRSDCHDDYRFLYFGPQGSWTPFHADVFRSFSWSANVCGKKRWILCAAGEEEKLKDVNRHLPFDVNTALLDSCGVKYYDILQNAGEVLFVPSGWYHQVFNLEDTLSINHNWLNAGNIDICWRFLNDSLAAVEQEIQEHRHTMDNWTEHCQLFLRADVGIDYVDLFNLLYVVANNRISATRIDEDRHGKYSVCLLRDDASRRSVDQRPVDCDMRGDDECVSDADLRGFGGSVPDSPASAAEGVQGSDMRAGSDDEAYHLIYELFRISEILVGMTRRPDIVEILEIGRERMLCSAVDLFDRVRTVVDGFLKTR